MSSGGCTGDELDVRRHFRWTAAMSGAGVIAGLCLVAGPTVAAGAPAQPLAAVTRQLVPSVSRLAASTRALPSRGGTVVLSARVHGATGCTLRVRPAIAKLPATKSCKAKIVKWRVRLPANVRETARVYRFTIAVRGAHHRVLTRARTVRVERAPPPRLTAVSQSATSMASTGGPVTFRANLANAVRCELSVTPAVLGLPSRHDCPGRSATWTVIVPPNPVDIAAAYQFTLTVHGTHGRVLTDQRTVTVAAQSPTCPGQTETSTPKTTAYFNDPTTNTATDQNAVVSAMINLICNVSPPVDGVPSTINLAMFIYQLDDVTAALLWAKTYRSAVINVALDGANDVEVDTSGQTVPNQAYLDLVAGLPAGSVLLCGPNAGQAPPPPIGGDGAAVRPSVAATAAPPLMAGTACAGDNILHTKLLLVSSVDTLGDSAVFTGSQNLNLHGEQTAFNNGLQLVGDASIYQADRKYFTQLVINQQRAGFGNALGVSGVASAAGTISEDFDPRNSPAVFPTTSASSPVSDAASDSTADLLDGVSCAPPGDFAGDHTGPARTTVQVAMFTYNNRPRITSRLEALAGQGCEVQVMYTMMSASNLAGLRAAGITPLQLSDDTYAYTNGSGTGRVIIHDKYLLVSGSYLAPGGTVSDQDIVLTGSENFTQASLHRNDDLTIAVRATATAPTGTTPIFSDYEANWNHLAAVIAALPSPPPAGG